MVYNIIDGFSKSNHGFRVHLKRGLPLSFKTAKEAIEKLERFSNIFGYNPKKAKTEFITGLRAALNHNPHWTTVH